MSGSHWEEHWYVVSLPDRELRGVADRHTLRMLPYITGVSRASSTSSSRHLSSTGSSLPQSRNWRQRSLHRVEVRRSQWHSSAPVMDTNNNTEVTTVYHWATITGGRYGRACGWFAGWWNALAWLLGFASIVQIVSAQAVSMYAVMHDGFVTQQWHVFVTYIIITWITVAVVLYLNRALPPIEIIGGFFVVAGVFISILVCAIMPHVNQQPYATNFSVWGDWQNQTGYSSSGFAFLAGMLNGAYAVGTPDLVTHLAEEVPQ